MQITNNQLNIKAVNLLKALKGKQLEAIIHEPFKFTTTSYGIVYLVVDGKTYIFTDYQKQMDYFKTKESLSSIEFEEHHGEKKSSLENIQFVSEEIKQAISKITLINTEQTATSKNTGETYKFLDTQCVIFTLENGYQLSLTKDDFCECISIYRGYNAIKEADEIKKRFANFYESDLEGTYSIDCLDL